MSGKKLSTGTLSLRFMQNAQRMKQLKEVQLEQAHVKDDGQWEIAKEIRDSWGTTAESDQSVTYETSYLPFLFPSLSSSTEPSQAGPSTASNSSIGKPKGRRVFKKGREVLEQQADTNSEVQPVQSETPPTDNATGKKYAARSAKNSRPIAKSTKVAKLAIFDNSDVGTDLRPPSNVAAMTSATVSKDVFIKPAGVDEPKLSAAAPDSEVVAGAREAKVKRERSSQSDADGMKRKKKRKTVG